MAVTNIPNVQNWTVTPQNGQSGYFDLMNTWLGQSTLVIASLQSAITAQNAANAEINALALQVENDSDITVSARDEALTALAILSSGSIDDTTIATNKAYSNSKSNTLLALKMDKDINSLTAKTNPVDADGLVLADSASTFSLKKLTWSNLKATLKTYFETLFMAKLPSVTGTATFTNSTQNINLTGIGSLSGLEIGDVIQISGAINSKNNSEFTVETITDANNIVVNYEHRGQTITTKALTNETSTSEVTIKLLSKWFNADEGLGRGWINVAGRALNVTYTNNTKRTFPMSIRGSFTSGTPYILVNTIQVSSFPNVNNSYNYTIQGDVTKDSTYSYVATGTISFWFELR